MKHAPFFINKIHFVGIGGIGMSGIAEILHHQGYCVSGSDAADNYNTQRLSNLGISVKIGHKTEHSSLADVVVVSSAISINNPEVENARALGIPVVQRAEMLAELMRLKWTISVGGSHGKTTTTSLIAMLLKKAQCGPTVISGGIINELKTNAELGLGEMMVVEADESDGSFQYLPSTMTVVTNIDPEHMSYYKTLDNLKEAFVRFIERTPFYGINVLCGDDENIKSILPHLGNRRILTYGFNNTNDVFATNIRRSAKGSLVDVHFSEHAKKLLGNSSKICDLQLVMHGKHNILNSLAAVGIARELDIADEVIRQAFLSFQGVKRRFTVTGVTNDVTFIDDYAHHPTEIKAVLQSAEPLKQNNLIAVIQPHRYTRLKDHFDEFVSILEDAKTVDQIYLLPVYTAGEDVILGAESTDLEKALKEKNMNVTLVATQELLKESLCNSLEPKDLVLFMGAGSITYTAQEMPLVYEKFMS